MHVELKELGIHPQFFLLFQTDCLHHRVASYGLEFIYSRLCSFTSLIHWSSIHSFITYTFLQWMPALCQPLLGSGNRKQGTVGS